MMSQIEFRLNTSSCTTSLTFLSLRGLELWQDSPHTLIRTPVAVRLKTTRGNLFPNVPSCRRADEAGALLPSVKRWCIIPEEVDFHLKITLDGCSWFFNLAAVWGQNQTVEACVSSTLIPRLIRNWWETGWDSFLKSYTCTQQHPGIDCDACCPPAPNPSPRSSCSTHCSAVLGCMHVSHLKQLADASSILHRWKPLFSCWISNWTRRVEPERQITDEG